jgi:competence protein ComEA
MVRNAAVFLVTGGSLALFANALVPSTAPPSTTAQDLPPGPGKAILIRVCGGCHEPQVVIGNHRSRDEWIHVMNSMISNGAQGDDEDLMQVLDYLRENFGPQVNVNTGIEKDFTSGLGLTTVEANAIIAYRKAHDKFTSIDDLKKIPGVDAAKIDAAKDKIVF